MTQQEDIQAYWPTEYAALAALSRMCPCAQIYTDPDI